MIFFFLIIPNKRLIVKLEMYTQATGTTSKENVHNLKNMQHLVYMGVKNKKEYRVRCFSSSLLPTHVERKHQAAYRIQKP